MKSLRIAFITPEFVTEPYFSGGLANYLNRVTAALAQLGHDVHVITFSDVDQATLEYQQIQVHRVGLGRLHLILDRLTFNQIPYSTKWLNFSLRVYRKLKQLHQQKPFDLIQSPDWCFPGLISTFLFRVPHIVRMSSYRPVWDRMTARKKTLDTQTSVWLEKLQLRLSQGIYTPSYALKKILETEIGIQTVQVIRTPFYLEINSFDLSTYEKHLKDKKYLLFFGRYEIHKGFHILAQALPKVFEKLGDCTAVFIGVDCGTTIAPSMREYTESLCPAYLDRLVFLGQTSHTQLYPIVQNAHLIVLPSLIDNLPNACLEAMALGKPVIGTIGTSLDELITDEETGFLVPAGEIDALAQKIIYAWSHTKLNAIGAAARQKISREFSPEKTIQQVINYYKQVIGYSKSS